MNKARQNPARQFYYYGRISREEAENRLKKKNLIQGSFLLRADMTVSGNYVLSLVYNQKVHHYSLIAQKNGNIMILDGKQFPGPVELIGYHRTNLDGLLTHTSVPCNRDHGTSPMAWPEVTMIEFEKSLTEAAFLQKKSLNAMSDSEKHHLMKQVALKLHRYQKWFHEKIDRQTAEERISHSRHENGKFLLRDKGDNTMALSLSFNNMTKHYRIDRIQGSYRIDDGPQFECLMDLVGHYHNRTDGLLCRLTKSCQKPYWRPRIYKFPDTYERQHSASSSESLWDEPETPDVSLPKNGIVHRDDHQKIYDALPFDERMFSICYENLETSDELGKGFFGSVMKGMLTQNSTKIPVAVKTLIRDELPHAKEEIMKEARLMARLRHPNVIRLIGICRTETLMLVLELAPLGQLNKYIKKRSPRIPTKNLCEILKQVALGMEYLSIQNFVHRDLAARNVLLVSETFAKISDFGMSKALGIGENYYKTESAGKWPLKWYAPECIWYFKFDTKSDVWSFGVTMWETFTYGDKPYRGMKGTEILEFIESGERLPQPKSCSDDIYTLMLECWYQSPIDRPSFSQIVTQFRNYRY